jgi:adenosylhomocysteine nucleosidase
MEELTLVLCPMEEELTELLGKIEKPEPTEAGTVKGFRFAIGGKEYFAFQSRIGKANIGFDLGLLSQAAKIRKIYVLGVAGSLKEDLVPLNVVVAEKVCYYDVDITLGGKYVIGQMAGEKLYYECDKEDLSYVKSLNTTLTIRTGTIISGDSFATKGNMTKELLAHFDDPLAVDMESGAAGQMAHRLGVPFVVIRGISDSVFATGDNGQVFSEMLSLAARRAASVFVHLVKEDYVPGQPLSQ